MKNISDLYNSACVKQNKSLGIFVEYYFYDPISESMDRRRIKLSRVTRNFSTKKEKLAFAQRVCDDVNRKLQNGWSPNTESADARLYTPMAEVAKAYLAAKRKEGLRETTLTNYSSFLGIFLDWCCHYSVQAKYSGTFLHKDAVAFMDQRMAMDNGNRAYNNMLKGMRAFYTWCVEHCYSRENPFVGIKSLRTAKKRRGLVDKEDRRLVLEYFDAHCPQMSLFCMLVFFSLLRPLEANRIQFKHIDLANRRIIVPEENAKNGKMRSATMSQEIFERMWVLSERYADVPEWFVFGEGVDLMPGKKPHCKTWFGKLWRKMRDEVGLGVECQLYSLRDSGITEFIKSGIDPLTVQHHADHSSLEIQAIYTNHFDKEMNRKIFDADVEF